MTHHHTPPANTPAPADGDDGLNAEIARALGWTNIRRHQKLSFGVITTNFRGTDPQGATGAIVPRYDSDPAATLGLLAHVLVRRTAYGPFVLHRIEKNERDKWLVLIGVEGSGESVGVADTLESAIAIACRDALAVMKEAEGVGESK